MDEEYNTLLDTIQQEILVPTAEREILKSSFNLIEKSKNEYLVQHGMRSPYLYFIVTGYIRVFHQNDKSDEITTDVLSANDFVTSFKSFLNNTNTKESIQCISKCKLLTISKEKYQGLYESVTEWPLFCQSIYEKNNLKISTRVNTLQNLSAPERYKELLDTYPNIVLNTPVKYLASYLGVQPQLLSKIRKEIK